MTTTTARRPVAPLSTPAITLRRYQQRSVEALTHSILARNAALDASGTGTGKTVVAAHVARSLGLIPMVICPAATVPQWVRTMQDCGHQRMFVSSYNKVRQGIDKVVFRVGAKKPRYHWHVDPSRVLAIFDEVHVCKGQKSLNSKLLSAAVKAGLPVLMLSATSAQDPRDMKALGYALGLHNHKGWWHWCLNNGCKPGRFGGLDFGQRAAAEHLPKLHKLIFEQGRGVRVTLADTGEEMPDNLVTSEALDFGFTPETDPYTDPEFYDALEDNPLVPLLRARMATEKAKAKWLADEAAELVREGRKVVIFHNFTETRHLIGDRLDEKHHLHFGMIHGGQSEADRRGDVECFSDDDLESHVLLVQLQAGGTGLDGLQDRTGRHPRVALICPSYSAIDTVQALGRIYRADTVSKCVQRIIFAAGTVEERAALACRAKLANIEMLNDGDMKKGIGR